MTTHSPDTTAARSLHLLAEFIQLRERYALLHPMLFSESVQWQYGDRKQWRGFDTLRRSLFLSCCQDIFKLTCDRTGDVSIRYCMDDLKHGKVSKLIRANYVAAELAIDEGYPAPLVAAIDKALASERAIKYGREFDRKYRTACEAWKALQKCETLAKCKVIRHELTAHTKLAANNYDPIDITKLGIPFSNLKPTINAMQELVDQIGGLVRGSAFAWQQLDRLMTTAANDFWKAQ
jgi:hypothetical protein